MDESDVRGRILEFLGAGPKTAGEISDFLERGRSGVSQHLQKLLHGGLVHVHPRGRERVYSLPGTRKPRAASAGMLRVFILPEGSPLKVPEVGDPTLEAATPKALLEAAKESDSLGPSSSEALRRALADLTPGTRAAILIPTSGTLYRVVRDR